jgi:hypothetical protein
MPSLPAQFKTVRPTRLMAAYAFDVRHAASLAGVAPGPSTERSFQNGELLLNPRVEVLEFVIVGVLGFMPLIVIHWAHRRARPLQGSRRRGLAGHLANAKASLLVWLTDWALSVML